MSKAAVAYTKKRFEKTGSDRNKKCSGRPRLSTKRQDRFLERIGLQGRFSTATRLQEDLEEIDIKSNTCKPYGSYCSQEADAHAFT